MIRKRGWLVLPFIVVVFSAFTVAAQVAPRTADDLVSVRGGFFGTIPGCGAHPNTFALNTRVKADGSEGSFTVPARKAFVVTGIDWFLDSAGGLSSDLDTVFLYLNDAIVFGATVPPGQSSNAVQLSGVSAAPGSTLCFGKSGPWNFAQVFVRGYFVDR